MNRQDDRYLIDVFELARTSGKVAGSLPFREAMRLRASLAGDGGAVDYEFRGFEDEHSRAGGELALQATLPLICDCCGNPYAFSVAQRTEYRFVGSDAELEAVPITVDEIEPLVGSRQFDLLELVEEEAILSIPISPRHPECVAAKPDPAAAARPPSERQQPFAELAKLKRRLQ